jgi:hypothetical protein
MTVTDVDVVLDDLRIALSTEFESQQQLVEVC